MSSKRLDGLNAVISGGAAGVGGAASEIFAAEGANVAIIDIQEEVGTALAEEICQSGGYAFFVKADVSSSDEVSTAIAQVNERFENRIDILFNHAGTVIIKPFLETTELEWDWMMNVNVKSMYLMTRAVLPSCIVPVKAHVTCLPVRSPPNTGIRASAVTRSVPGSSRPRTGCVNSRNCEVLAWR